MCSGEEQVRPQSSEVRRTSASTIELPFLLHLLCLMGRRGGLLAKG